MKQNFEDCLNRVLKSEGGYTNDPKDPGGPTNFGITLADYRMYIDRSGGASAVRNMSLDQAKAIYKSKYWDKVNGDTLPSGVDYTVFDYGVNSGVARANRVYNKLKQPDPIKTINAINDERLAFLHSLSTWSHFGRGWGTRVSGVRQHSIDLARQPTNTHNKVAGSIAAGGAIATASSQIPHQYWSLILGITVLTAFAVGVIVYWYKQRKVNK